MLFYGVVRSVFYFLDTVLTYTQKINIFDKLPWSKYLLSLDISMAGRFLSMIYVVHHVITVFSATLRIKTGRIYVDVSDVMHVHSLLYVVYALIGAILLIAYFIVVYTDYNIDKDDRYNYRYKMLGICGGLIFILSLPLMYIFKQLLEGGLYKTFRKNTSLTVFLCVISMLLAYVTVNLVIKYNRDEKLKKMCADGRVHVKTLSFQDIISLLLIPINFV